MARKKQNQVSPKPLLSIAAFCTKVLEGNDGLMSGIRFVEDLTFLVPPDRDPERREPLPIWALIAFKSH
jgi:hypothetical protein